MKFMLCPCSFDSNLRLTLNVLHFDSALGVVALSMVKSKDHKFSPNVLGAKLEFKELT
jgi:hypothetical protein